MYMYTIFWGIDHPPGPSVHAVCPVSDYDYVSCQHYFQVQCISPRLW